MGSVEQYCNSRRYLTAYKLCICQRYITNIQHNYAMLIFFLINFNFFLLRHNMSENY